MSSPGQDPPVGPAHVAGAPAVPDVSVALLAPGGLAVVLGLRRSRRT